MVKEANVSMSSVAPSLVRAGQCERNWLSHEDESTEPLRPG
jgi:hypothetical protein